VLYDGEVCLGGGVIARAAVPALPAAVVPPRRRHAVSAR
jgi:hypothetical protein